MKNKHKIMTNQNKQFTLPMMNNRRLYSTYIPAEYLTIFKRYQTLTKETIHRAPHLGLILASTKFQPPYPSVNEVELLSSATMDLLIQGCYPRLLVGKYAKFTILFRMQKKEPFVEDEFSFSLGPAIPLTHQDGMLLPENEVYSHIYNQIIKYGELYDGDLVVELTVRGYTEGGMKLDKDLEAPHSEETRLVRLYNCKNDKLLNIDPINSIQIRNRNRKYSSHITRLKPSNTKLKGMIVADTETLLVNNNHKPYAAGLMVVRPDQELDASMIDTYFSEDYTELENSFEKRSQKVLIDLLNRIQTIIAKKKRVLFKQFTFITSLDSMEFYCLST